MSCTNPDRFVNICVDGQPVGTGNPLPISGGSGPGSNVVVTDIEDGAGDSVMDAVNDAVRVNVVAGGAGGGAVTIADGADEALGAKADAAAGADTGTFSVVAILKRLMARFTTLLSVLPAALTGSGNFKVAIQEAIPAGTNSIGQVTAAIKSINYTDAANRDIDVGGASQQVFAANAARTGLIIQNISDEDLWLDFDQAATLDTPSIRLIGGGLGILQFPDTTGRIELGAVNINGATAGQKFVAKEATDA